jgi:hypothetical protein
MESANIQSASKQPSRTLHWLAVVTLFAGLAVALYWLVRDIEVALQSGREFDMHRRWVVCQFVRHGINPYPIALRELEHTYGELGGARPKPRVYAMPRSRAGDSWTSAERELLEGVGAPEAVYPPAADLFLAFTIGALPSGAVHVAAVALNLSWLIVCVAMLKRPQTGWSHLPIELAPVFALTLLWSPTRLAIVAGQFSLFVTACLLLALRRPGRHQLVSGLWFALALIKPSMALPFLILPLVHGRWRTLAVAVGMHAVATGLAAARFGVAPWELLRQWTGVAAYFAQGQFTLHEMVAAFRLSDTVTGYLIVTGFALFVAGWSFRNRRADDDVLFDWLCFVSFLWTYHGPYDLVILLVPIARWFTTGLNAQRSEAFNAWIAVGLFMLVGVAASSRVFGDEVHLSARLVRHAARLALWCGFAALTLDVRRSARAATYSVARPRTDDDSQRDLVAA